MQITMTMEEYKELEGYKIKYKQLCNCINVDYIANPLKIYCNGPLVDTNKIIDTIRKQIHSIKDIGY